MRMTTITHTAKGQLAVAQGLAQLMDAAFKIPGTKIRLGVDGILGLLPVVGDLIGSAIGGYIVLIASHLGVPRAVIWRMVWNLGVDAVIGFIPLVGDLLDISWKANLKNVTLLEQALTNPEAARKKSIWALLGIVSVVILLTVTITVLVLALVAPNRIPSGMPW